MVNMVDESPTRGTMDLDWEARNGSKVQGGESEARVG